MRNAVILVVAPMLGLSLVACGGGSGSTGTGGTSGGTGGAGGGTEVCSAGSVIVHEANDYMFTDTLMFPPVKVKPNTELTFDWSGGNKDLLNHDVDPKADVNMVLAMLWKLTRADLEAKLTADDVKMKDLEVLPLTYTTDGTATSAKLYDFTLNGNPLTPDQIMPYFDPATYDPASHIYTMMTAKGTVLGQGTLMVQSFELDASATEDTVFMKGDSTMIDYTANVHSLTPIWINGGSSAITLDWGQMTTNAIGNPFITTNITNALVARYTQPLSDLEAKFLDLELLAADLYRADITSGTVLDFSMLKKESGESFPGIDGTGTWVVALQCGGCRNPAPWFLSILKPCTK